MRFTQAIVFVAFISPCLVFVATPAQASPDAELSVRAPLKMQQKLVQGQAEVRHLERDVHQQELDSQRASQRLQQQDQAIAELQKQLQALQPGQPGRQH